MASETAAATTAEGGLTITRVFEAPRQLVWQEWTEPERFADWFGGADTEVPLSTVSIDLKPGGAWKATTLSYGPGRRDICWEGEYLEVIEPQRLVFSIRGLHPDQANELVTVILSDLGNDRTEMLFRQQGARTAEQWERAREAWSSEFDRIADRLLDPPTRRSPTIASPE